MRHDEFLTAVQERAQLDADGAERATEATLTALAERLEQGEATDFASQLPQELKEKVRGAAGGTGEPIALTEFIRKVAQKEGVSEYAARQHACAVVDVLREQLTEGQVDDVLSQLPEDYRTLFAG
jgi:uncharacterized protein (DUF2267 family)